MLGVSRGPGTLLKMQELESTRSEYSTENVHTGSFPVGFFSSSDAWYLTLAKKSENSIIVQSKLWQKNCFMISTNTLNCCSNKKERDYDRHKQLTLQNIFL